MKTYFAVLTATLLLGGHPLIAEPAKPSAPERWTAERANNWYAQQPWLVGANFVPSTAINQLEMWQAETFDPATIDRELGYAQQIGMNTMRVFLHDLAWREDSEGFYSRVDKYLTIADRHGIKTLFVIFDGVWFPNPRTGTQPAPVPGRHNSGWVQSPGRAYLESPEKQDELKPYVIGLLTRFNNDRRVLAWDLFNEPDNPNRQAYGRDGAKIELAEQDKEVFAGQLLEKTYAWAKEVQPSQPVTSGVWLGDYLANPTAIQRLQLEQSDIITFHNYDGPVELRKRIEGLKKLGRPVLCTEYMARGNHSTFTDNLPVMKEFNVAAWSWGLVSGKSNTIYPWDSWEKHYTNEPAIWFHDVFRPDGTPFSLAEVNLIRTLTGRGTPQSTEIKPSAQAPAAAATVTGRQHLNRLTMTVDRAPSANSGTRSSGEVYSSPGGEETGEGGQFFASGAIF